MSPASGRLLLTSVPSPSLLRKFFSPLFCYLLLILLGYWRTACSVSARSCLILLILVLAEALLAAEAVPSCILWAVHSCAYLDFSMDQASFGMTLLECCRIT